MDLSSLGNLVASAAPTLGKILVDSIPGANLVVKGLSALFGASDDPEDLARKIQQDPQSYLKLQQFEKEHAQAMLALTLKDREDARERELEYVRRTGNRDWVVPTLAGVVTTAFFALIFTLCFVHPGGSLRGLLEIMLGQASAGETMVLSYYFGSMNTDDK